MIGCEIAGAVKNVLAIASGMSIGLGFGDNTRAALITRSLAELTRLGVALGGEPATFAGLAGLGDLVATCTSAKSRNFAVGVALGQGESLEEVIGRTRMVAEGVKTCRPVVDLARRLGVEVPGGRTGRRRVLREPSPLGGDPAAHASRARGPRSRTSSTWSEQVRDERPPCLSGLSGASGRRRTSRDAGVEVETRLVAAGCRTVAGIDEVGRGAWAGPLTVGVPS